jgi:hypothetical protein
MPSRIRSEDLGLPERIIRDRARPVNAVPGSAGGTSGPAHLILRISGENTGQKVMLCGTLHRLPEIPRRFAMQRAGSVALTCVLLSVAGMSLSAHHSFAAAYDTSKSITVQGAIVQVRLTNPHSWFFLDVKDQAA